MNTIKQQHGSMLPHLHLLPAVFPTRYILIHPWRSISAKCNYWLTPSRQVKVIHCDSFIFCYLLTVMWLHRKSALTESCLRRDEHEPRQRANAVKFANPIRTAEVLISRAVNVHSDITRLCLQSLTFKRCTVSVSLHIFFFFFWFYLYNMFPSLAHRRWEYKWNAKAAVVGWPLWRKMFAILILCKETRPLAYKMQPCTAVERRDKHWLLQGCLQKTAPLNHDTGQRWPRHIYIFKKNNIQLRLETLNWPLTLI